MPAPGTGVICKVWALRAAVIPAKVGIYSANLRGCAVDGLDSRFRGNDCAPNDTSTRSVLPRDTPFLTSRMAPRFPVTISRVMESIKVGSTLGINAGIGERGLLWQPRFFDRDLRGVKEY